MFYCQLVVHMHIDVVAAVRFYCYFAVGVDVDVVLCIVVPVVPVVVAVVAMININSQQQKYFGKSSSSQHTGSTTQHVRLMLHALAASRNHRVEPQSATRAHAVPNTAL